MLPKLNRVPVGNAAHVPVHLHDLLPRHPQQHHRLVAHAHDRDSFDLQSTGIEHLIVAGWQLDLQFSRLGHRRHFVSYNRLVAHGADTLHLPNCDSQRHHIVLHADTELDFSGLDLFRQLAIAWGLGAATRNRSEAPQEKCPNRATKVFCTC
jgi:hypothetical protein